MTPKQIDQAIEVGKKISLDYKPDGIGGSCDCDVCNDIRPKYDALQTLISTAEAIRDAEVPKKKEWETPLEERETIEWGYGFNQAYDLFTPLLAKRDLRILELEKELKNGNR